MFGVACTCAGQDEAKPEGTKQEKIHSTCTLCVGVSSGQLLMELELTVYVDEDRRFEPSDSRSSWSKWRNMVVTVLEINNVKSLPLPEWVWIVIHFFLIRSKIFLVEKVALFGTRVRELERASFEWFPFFLREACLLLILEDYRAIPYWIWLVRCEFRSQNAQSLLIPQRKLCHRVYRLMESQLPIHSSRIFTACSSVIGQIVVPANALVFW